MPSLQLLHYRGRIWVVYSSSRIVTHHYIPLHWCHDMRCHSGTALYMERISAQPPYRGYPVTFQAINHTISRTTTQHALHCLCLVSESLILYFTTTYQAYCKTYKTHAMALYHGGAGQPLDRDATTSRSDATVDVTHDFQTEDTDDI